VRHRHRVIAIDRFLQQQKIADVFYELKLIPKPVRIADAIAPAAKVATAR